MGARGRGRGRGGRGQPEKVPLNIQYSRDVELRVLLDDAEGGESACGPGLRRFELVPHAGRSYPHLEPYGQLYALAPAEEPLASASPTGNDGRPPESHASGLHPSEAEVRSGEGVGEGIASRGAEAQNTGHGIQTEKGGDTFMRERQPPEERETEQSPEGREGEAEAGGGSLIEEVRNALGPALERVHVLLGGLAESVLRRSTVERTKLMVRLGRLLLTLPQGARYSTEKHYHSPYCSPYSLPLLAVLAPGARHCTVLYGMVLHCTRSCLYLTVLCCIRSLFLHCLHASLIFKQWLHLSTFSLVLTNNAVTDSTAPHS